MSEPTLTGWMIRDVVITGIVAAGLVAGTIGLSSDAGWLVSTLVAVPAFIACYVLCYILHEWGHYIGARLTGLRMPLAPYKGAFLGQFHIDDYDRRQYLWLSWGGDIGHVIVTLIAVLLYLSFGGITLAAFAVGGVAFSIQSLAVDQPVIWKVTFGADFKEAAAVGTTPQVILKRTWQTWIPGAAVLIAYQFI